MAQSVSQSHQKFSEMPAVNTMEKPRIKSWFELHSSNALLYYKQVQQDSCISRPSLCRQRLLPRAVSNVLSRVASQLSVDPLGAVKIHSVLRSAQMPTCYARPATRHNIFIHYNPN